MSKRWLFHSLTFPAFRRVFQTLRLAPQDARRPFVWFSTAPDPEVGANEVILCLDRDAIEDQLFQRGDTFRSKDPHKPVRFKPEWLDRVLVKDVRLIPGVQAMMPDVRVTPLGHDMVTSIDDARLSENWERPCVVEEATDIERVAKDLDLRPAALAGLIMRSPLEPLKDETWSELQNTESWDCRTLDRVAEIAKLYDKDSARIVSGLQNNEGVPAPIVLEREDGSVTLVAGNTRLCACRALGIRPQVVYVRLDDEPAPSTTTDDDQADAESAARPHDGKVKGKRAVIGAPNNFKKEPHGSHTIAKTDPRGYIGQHVPTGGKIKLSIEQQRRLERALSAENMFKPRGGVDPRE